MIPCPGKDLRDRCSYAAASFRGFRSHTICDWDDEGAIEVVLLLAGLPSEAEDQWEVLQSAITSPQQLHRGTL